MRRQEECVMFRDEVDSMSGIGIFRAGGLCGDVWWVIGGFYPLKSS